MSGEGHFAVIDQTYWPRREQFELFMGFGSPYFSITADVDITAYRESLPKGGRFTIGLVYALAAAANAVEQFRQRIRGSDVIEFDVVHPSIIVLNADDAFRFCNFPFAEDFKRFSEGAPERIEQARKAPSMFSAPDQDDYLYLTGLPWISFSGVTHAAPTHAPDSVPRIAWGKYRHVAGRIVLPLNVQVHHALVDGIHVGRFYAHVEEILSHAEQWLGETDAPTIERA
ncbi:chloramphenicol acetyltransferase [Candidatus Bipolaricaulota bacterium]|nr:chloramphenicol acetyltransferase [Candidatus Bipolaricaulota bacterium]